MPIYLVIAKKGNMRWLCEHLGGGTAVFVMRHHAADYIDHNQATGIQYEIVRLLVEIVHAVPKHDGE